MASNKTKICRLCIKLISTSNFEAIEEIRMDMLDVLLINMNFNISKEPVACNGCVETVQNCFDFKSTCFYVDDCIMPFKQNYVKVDISQVFRKKMKISEEIKLEYHQICRLCMALIENDSFKSITKAKSDIWVTNMVHTCLPELDLTSTYDPSICDMCLSSLQCYFKFMKTCLNVEEKINEYHKNNAKISNDKVDLHEVLQFTIKMNELNQNNSIVENIKTEDGDMDFETNYSGNDYIKYEEASFKLESDQMSGKSFDEEPHLPESDKNNLENGNVSVNLKKKTNCKENCTYPCAKCSYATNHAASYEAHLLRSHHDPPIFMCDLCGYRTDEKSNLKSHLLVHRGATKPFGCKECKFETNVKRCYLKHLLLHLPIYKCEFCSFKSENKSAVVNHTKANHDENITYYKCTECNFKSKQKGSLTYHMVLHKNPEDITMHQCPHCKFKSRYNANLRQHLFIHDDSEKSRKYICSKCPYRTWRPSHLKRHLRTHMGSDQSNTPLYSCSQCKYVSKLRANLNRHMQTHLKPGERKLFKCSICDYEAKMKISVTHHMLSHQDPLEVTKIENSLGYHKHTMHKSKDQLETFHKDPSEITTYKCDECSYETKTGNRLIYHKHTMHKSLNQLETFKCKHCPYEGKTNRSLTRHLVKHLWPDQVEMFKCQQCNFKTKHELRYYDHIRAIHNAQTLPFFKCELCEYETMSKDNLNHHKLTHLGVRDITM